MFLYLVLFYEDVMNIFTPGLCALTSAAISKEAWWAATNITIVVVPTCSIVQAWLRLTVINR